MKLKKFAAVISAAALALALTGCGKEETQSAGNISKTEIRAESVAGSNTNTPASTKQEESQPEEKSIAMTDEIKKAALNSGLVQYNNDVFQRGGYITVADFVEKYKDKYDITYKDGSYEERKDYLVAYSDGYFNGSMSVGYRWPNKSGGYNNYALTLTPKNNNGGPVTAYIANVTSPDEKITIDKAIVMELNYSNETVYSGIVNTPEWIPMGFADNENYFIVKFESENKKYNVDNLSELLEANGLKKNATFDMGASIVVPSPKGEENWITYWKKSSGFGCYVLGEENLFGAKPLYYYSFIFDPNTDKLNYVGCTLEYFIKE